MAVLLRLASYTLPYKRRLVLVYVSLVGSTLLSLAIPRILGRTIDTALEKGQSSDLTLLALLVVAVALARGALSYGEGYLAEFVSQHVAYDIRHAFLARLQSLSFAFHDRQKTGDLMSRATSDVESIRWFVSFGLIFSLHILVLVVGVAVLLMTTHLSLGLISLAAVPVAAFIAIRMSLRFTRLWRDVQAETGRMTTLLQENLSGMRVVKAFGGEDYEKGKFGESAHALADKSFTVNRLLATNGSLLNLLFALVTALVIWYGGSQIIDARLTAGEVTEFVLYLGLLVFPIRMSGWVVNSCARAASAGERIFQVLDARSTVEERQNAISLGRARGEVAFEGVSFSYSLPPANENTGNGVDALRSDHLTRELGKSGLRNINLKVLPGQKVAMLGAPGSGKTSMVNLIPRFYDVTGGKVTIDGFDVREITLESCRSNVGVVFQDVFLFMATIRENVSYGVTGATDEQVVAAARSAHIHDFIMGLPDGYDSLVGERGVTLSGGQRQRMAIARTLLLDPPILVLDDSTSSVDAETEYIIQDALAKVMKGRTTFIIAHRVSSVRRADLILVMKDGEIGEMGTHQQLLSQKGLYDEIYRLQLLPEGDVLAETPADGDP